jgi:hypothetical protein
MRNFLRGHLGSDTLAHVLISTAIISRGLVGEDRGEIAFSHTSFALVSSEVRYYLVSRFHAGGTQRDVGVGSCPASP